ncbi:MAG TPA: hypothetical protein VJR89_42120 [Polyangiales bacterium]|nr:hypothetical protein [Polyangiales bacterium]
MLTRLAAYSVIALASVACTELPGPDAAGSDSAAPITSAPANDECAGDIPSYAQVTAFAKCANCHAASKTGADRHGATPAVDFDTEAAADARGNAAVSMVMSGFMPPAGSGIALTRAEKERLYEWVMCRM